MNETGTFLFILKEETTILKLIVSVEEYMNSRQPQPHKKIAAEFNACIKKKWSVSKLSYWSP